MGKKSDKDAVKNKNILYDDECKRSKRTFNNNLTNNFKQDHSELIRQEMVNARSPYKQLIRQKRYTYNVSQTRKLEDMRYKSAKEYWSLLKYRLLDSLVV